MFFTARSARCVGASFRLNGFPNLAGLLKILGMIQPGRPVCLKYLLVHPIETHREAHFGSIFLGLEDDQVDAIRMAAHVMDVGKIGIRESVLNKPGALTAEEFEHVKSHVTMSIEILSPIKPLANALDPVRHHHEHFDGTGYPVGLAGEQISIGGRILAAADTYDALTSRRPWREPMTPRDAVAFLEERSGSLLDPQVFSALRGIVTRRKTLSFLDPDQG